MYASRWLGIALAVFASASQYESQERQVTNGAINGPYDYIVVGSGPGGGPLAARLALAGKKVLLLEAGGDPGNLTEYQVPALSLQSTAKDDMRWDYYVNHYSSLEAQEKDTKMTYRLPSGELYIGTSPPLGSLPLGILYPRAGTLGGCGSHNAMITIYPHESDWENLRNITGDDTWAPGNMRKYYEKLENSEYLPNSIIGHGFGGWLTTSVTDIAFVLQDSKLLSVVLSAAVALGQNLQGIVLSTIEGLLQILTLDVNSYTMDRDNKTGLFQVPIAVNNGVRNGPREFLLNTANAKSSTGARRYHLDIQLNTLVTKVRFDQTDTVPKAIGVDFITGQSLFRADPRSQQTGNTGIPGSVNGTEIILSAGAFNTPQLLKLSGVGPTDELNSFDIPVVVDLPGVGTNLQDRYETAVIGDSTSDFVISENCTFLRTDDDPCLTNWRAGSNNYDRGIYASNGISIGLVKNSSVAEGDPDLFITGAPVYFPGYYDGYAYNASLDQKHWSWITLKAHSRNSAGTVKLKSTDPRDTPLIEFNSFNDSITGALDVQAIVEGMQFARKMFRSVIPLDGSFNEVWPGTGVETDDELADFIRNEAWGHHASCTCPIGPDSDPNAVLDTKFQVRGTRNLRVVDASVFPKIPGFYIALPTYMISEKAADVILGI